MSGLNRSGLLPAPATGGPQCQLALALQCRSFRINTANNRHILIQGAQLFIADVLDPDIKFRVADAFAVRRHQLEHVAAGPQGILCTMSWAWSVMVRSLARLIR